jgi:hypothetical protein
MSREEVSMSSAGVSQGGAGEKTEGASGVQHLVQWLTARIETWPAWQQDFVLYEKVLIFSCARERFHLH